MEKKGRSLGRSRGRTSRQLTDQELESLRPGPSKTPPTLAGGDVSRPGPSSSTSEHLTSDRVSRPEASSGRTSREFALPTIKTRPLSLVSKKGTSGIPVDLCANYFPLAAITDWTLYQYHVDFKPEEDRPGIRKLLIAPHRATIGGYLFDGMIMYCSTELPSPTILTSVKQDGTKVQITLKLTRKLCAEDREYLQFFNTLMRRCLGLLNLKLVGRNFYDPFAKISEGDIQQYKMELWPGYVTSIRQHEHKILMCTEITHKVMRKDSVLDLLTEVKNTVGDYQKTFKTTALGLVVLTDYNNRTYRVDDVDFNVSPNSRFMKKDGSDCSYVEYYLQRYDIRIRNLEQPMLISKCKAKDIRAGLPETVYLVPELCRMTGLSDSMRSNFRLMAALAEHTRVGPEKRIEKLLSFSQRLRSSAPVVSELSQWNMQVADHLMPFQGRILPNEKIFQGPQDNLTSYPAGPKVDWTQNLTRNPMLAIGDLKDWVVMVPEDLENITETFIKHVMAAGFKMNMKMNDPIVRRLPNDRQQLYVSTLEEVLSKKNPQIVVCVVSNNRGDRYGAIKKKCCVDRAVPTQIITARAMNSRGLISVANKVAIQINCKIGGAPWTVEVPLKGTMVVGFDTSHDTMNKGVSYGAMVATLNNSFSRYFSAVSAHRSVEELSNDVSVNLIKALQKYRVYNDGALPSRIIMYRDGVGDGQIPFVFKHEVAVLKERLTDLYEGADKWSLGFVVVSKKINSRIFTSSRHNPAPGTVVDDCITLPERYDFFIVSQSVRQGTVSPTSYNVIFDNTGLNPDKMQRLTYKMTHLYYNWSGTVRVPAQVQYAHKLAQLVGQHIHKLPKNDMEDLLYFL